MYVCLPKCVEWPVLLKRICLMSFVLHLTELNTTNNSSGYVNIYGHKHVVSCYNRHQHKVWTFQTSFILHIVTERITVDTQLSFQLYFNVYYWQLENQKKNFPRSALFLLTQNSSICCCLLTVSVVSSLSVVFNEESVKSQCKKSCSVSNSRQIQWEKQWPWRNFQFGTIWNQKLS